MTSTLKYKGYTGTIEIDTDADRLCGRVLFIRGLIVYAQIYDKWVTNILKRVGSSFSPSLASAFNLTGFNGCDFGSGPRSPEGSPGGATEGTTGPTAGAAETGVIARCQQPALQRRLSEFAE